MDFARPEIMVFVFLAIASVALFSFLSVHSYIAGRRREREAYYKNETVRRLTESQGAGAGAAVELMHQEEAISIRRRLEGLKLGGLITSAVGIGFMIFLYAVNDADGHKVALIGLIPLLVGVALLVYVYGLATKAPKAL